MIYFDFFLILPLIAVQFQEAERLICENLPPDDYYLLSILLLVEYQPIFEAG